MEQYGGGIERVATTATAAGTTTLVNTSPQIEVFTGSTTQTVILPVATTYTKAGAKFELYNRSSGSIAVQYQDASPLQTIPANASLIVKCVDNTTANGTWVTLSNSAAPSINAPTFQIFTSGSGTYTTPSGPTPLYLKVRIAAGGGGGGGGGASGGTGSTGSNSTFGTSLLTVNGGTGGEATGYNPGSGGATTVNSPAIQLVATSGAGNIGIYNAGAETGGTGGQNPLSGAAAGSQGGAPGVAIANTGAGGTGGAGSGFSGSGGGSGGYIEAIINIPSATYAYSIGTGGAGGSPAGGTGADGIIIVEEFYQ